MTVQSSIDALRDDFRGLRKELVDEDGVLHKRVTNHEVECAKRNGEITTQLKFIRWFGVAAGGALIAFEISRLLAMLPPVPQ